jgi:hypothetical protein
MKRGNIAGFRSATRAARTSYRHLAAGLVRNGQTLVTKFIESGTREEAEL